METSEEVNESKSNTKVHEEVKSTDEVNPAVEKCSVDLANLVGSCYCKPPCGVCKNVPSRESTSAQCSINDGNELHHLVEMRNLLVYIQNELNNDSRTLLLVSPSTTISSLKGMLHRDSANCVNQFSASALALSFNDEVLDESRTLADYSIQDHDVINLYECSKYRYEISIGVPTYAKMEQVLFMPQDTIADVKEKVEMNNPVLKDTAGMREAYRIALRGTIKNATGTTSCLYLDLFSEEMRIIIHEREGNSTFYYSSILDGEYTVDNILKFISREECVQERLLHLSNWSFPRSFSVDSAWMHTFAPQIEARPHSSNTPIPLFFFPLRTTVFQLRVKSLNLPIPQFISSFTEKALGMKGVMRYMYHPQTGTFLSKKKRLFHYHDMLAPASEPYSVILTKPFTNHQKYRKSRTYAACVSIRWSTGKITLKVNLSDTVNYLQDKIEDDLMVPVSMQKLMFDGKPMQGNCTLNEIGIVNGSEIDLHPIVDFE